MYFGCSQLNDTNHITPPHTQIILRWKQRVYKTSFSKYKNVSIPTIQLFCQKKKMNSNLYFTWNIVYLYCFSYLSSLFTISYIYYYLLSCDSSNKWYCSEIIHVWISFHFFVFVYTPTIKCVYVSAYRGKWLLQFSFSSYSFIGTPSRFIPTGTLSSIFQLLTFRRFWWIFKKDRVTLFDNPSSNIFKNIS